MKLKTIIFFICTFPLLAWSQNTLTSDTLIFSQTIIDYSIDTSGSIFVSFEGGTITKYSPTLDSLFTYSPTKQGNTRLLESGTGLIIFAFYDFFQEYLITDRFLARPVRTKLSSSFIDYIDIATQSLDNNIWLVETSNFRLLKYNVTVDRIEIETVLNTIIDTPDNSFTFIKEYQNQVYLIDENSGIYVFDNLGNFSKFIAAKTDKCSFFKDELFYLENNKVVSVNIYSDETKKENAFVKGAVGIMKYNNKSYFVSKHSIISFF